MRQDVGLKFLRKRVLMTLKPVLKFGWSLFLKGVLSIAHLLWNFHLRCRSLFYRACTGIPSRGIKNGEVKKRRISYKVAAVILNYKMTEEEKEAQRRSFCFGNIRMGNDDITREMVDVEADKLNVCQQSDS